MMVLLVGCNTNNYASSLASGGYLATSDTVENRTPYLRLSKEDNTFFLCADKTVSYASTGTYEVVGKKLIATSQSTTYIFKIRNDETLVLVDNGGDERFPKNTRFVFSEE